MDPRVAARPRCCGSLRGSIAILRAVRSPLPRHARHGVPGAAPARLAHGRAERAARRAAREDAELAALFEMLGAASAPQSLSRRAFARARATRRTGAGVAVNPDLLLLDEPFVSLDAELALRLRDELAELVNRRSLMTLLVYAQSRRSHRARRSDFLSFCQPCARPCRNSGRLPAGAQRPEEIAALRDGDRRRRNSRQARAADFST